MMSSLAPEVLFSRLLPDPAATAAFGTALASLLRPGDVVALWGDLGAGKSTLARALIQALSIMTDEVPSPTFTLVQTYDGQIEADSGKSQAVEVWHFDLYRLTNPDQAYDLAIEEAFQDGISLIEWPDRLGYLLPVQRLDLYLETIGDGRLLRLAGPGDWPARLTHLQVPSPTGAPS
jgi:tRNA threonylcarbamoyladenosine biosynthesis protein TsaE